MDFNTDVPSTVIDTDTGPSASGGGIPNLTEPVDTKPASLRDDLESVFNEDADKQKVEEQPKDEKPADDEKQEKPEIGRAHVCTPVTNAHLVCRLLLEKTKIT